MATSWDCKLTNGTTAYDIQLVYDPAATEKYFLQANGSLGAGEPVVIKHQPDNEASRLVRAYDPERTFFFTCEIKGATRDACLNAVTDLKRRLSSARSRAIQNALDGTTPAEYVRVKPQGATRYTDHKIRWGHVDDSAAHYTRIALTNFVVQNVVLALELEPYGDGATITLSNYLPSSPHFLNDSDGDGTADGWTLLGTPTATLDTTYYLAGGKSQKLVTNTSASHGIISGTVTAAISSTAVAYIWLYHAGGDRVAVQLLDGSSTVIQTKYLFPSDSTAQSDKSAVDSTGATWYRIVVSGTNSGAANFIFRISRQSADATQATTFYCDLAYLQTGTTTAPDAWCSNREIKNRHDFVTANQERINALDVWGIPGDVPALVKYQFDGTTASTARRRYWITTNYDTTYLAAQQPHWIESDEFTYAVESGGTGAWSDQTGTSDNHYKRFTEGATANGGYFYTPAAYWVSNPAEKFCHRPRRLFLAIRSSTLNARIVATTKKTAVNAWPYEYANSDSVGVSAVNVWEILDLGNLDTKGSLLGQTDLRITFSVSGLANTETFDFDFLWASWAEEDQWFILQTQTATAVVGSLVVDGANRYAYWTQAPSVGYIEVQALGGVWTLQPGNIMNRLVILETEVSGGYVITQGWTVSSIVITPRARHLLGTT